MTGLDLYHNGANLSTVFAPQHARRHDADADAIIDRACRLEDWPELSWAIDLKIAGQREVVDWWQENVRRAGQPKKYSPVSPLISVDEATALTGITQQQISRWKKRLQTPEAYARYIFAAAFRAAFGTNAPNVLASQSVQWFTPEKYVAAVREVFRLGAIDLDVASCPEAQETVQANRYYTVDDDGLQQSWVAENIYLNPPYCGHAGDFALKLVETYKAGHVHEAILLVNNLSTSTKWFQPLFDFPLCFTDHKIAFVGGLVMLDINRPTCGSIFAYLGPDGDRFQDVFEQFGPVVVRRHRSNY
jgi:hypothetical protein